MFSNLSKGSVLHGADKENNGMKWFTGTIERVIPSTTNQYQSNFPQFPVLNLDIVATINGRQREFQGIPANDSIADFGKNAFILADSEESLFNYVKSLLRTSEDAVNEDNITWHKNMIPQYKKFLSDMRPGIANNEEVRELKEQVGFLQSQLAEALSLLKSDNSKKV